MNSQTTIISSLCVGWRGFKIHKSSFLFRKGRQLNLRTMRFKLQFCGFLMIINRCIVKFIYEIELLDHNKKLNKMINFEAQTFFNVRGILIRTCMGSSVDDCSFVTIY